MRQSIKLLYVDDEEVNVLIFEAMFRTSYNLTCVTSGREALSVMEKDLEINVLISDLSMPGMDGFELLEKTREIRPDISRYIMTAHFLNKKIQDALEEGLALGLVNKPFKAEEIKELLEEEN